jgi:hypothetical protein
MTKIHASTELAHQLASATGPIQIVNDDGMILGLCMPANLPKSPPLSHEQIEQRRKELEPIRERIRKNPRSGKKLSEIVSSLERCAGEGP